MVRDVVNKIHQWKVDKKGLHVQSKIITPIIDYIENHIRKYGKEYRKHLETKMSSTAAFEKFTVLLDILTDIEDGKLAKNIVRYIAPHFASELSTYGKQLDSSDDSYS